MYSKSSAANILVGSDLTLDRSFKVKKLWQLSIKVPISGLLFQKIAMSVNLQETIGYESFVGVRFDLGPLLQGQTMPAQYISAYVSTIVGSRGLQYTVNLQETIVCDSFGSVRFDLGPLLQGQTMVAQHKSARMTLTSPSNRQQPT